MKKILFALLLAFSMAGNAQTIHWLTFIDNQKNGTATEYGDAAKEVLYNHFINVINSALAEKGYKSNIINIYGSSLSPEKCKQIVQQFQCSSSDIVVFYYWGHGTHGNSVNGDYPLMWLGQDNPYKVVPLTWVHNQLKGKNPRLIATIGMCCNSYDEYTPRISEPTFSQNFGNTYLGNTDKTAIQKMFLEYSGDFLAASSAKGQPSWAGNTPFGIIDLFTAALVTNFESDMAAGQLEWTQLFKEVRDGVNAEANRQHRRSQIPIFTNNLRACSAPAKRAPSTTPVDVTPRQQDVTPSSDSNPNMSEQEFLNRLTAAFDNLISTSNSDMARINQEETLSRAFASNAVVRTMSQDGNVVVDRSSASDFLGRLSTSRVLLKVIPISVKITNGKISELKVKETYKK